MMRMDGTERTLPRHAGSHGYLDLLFDLVAERPRLVKTRARDAQPLNALLIDQDVSRNGSHAEDRLHPVVAIEVLRPYHAVLPHELVPRALLAIAADADDDERIARVILVEPAHRRQRLHAGSAPTRPEIQQYDLAAQRVERELLVFGSRDRELRRVLFPSLARIGDERLRGLGGRAVRAQLDLLS